MAEVKLQAAERAEFGKGAARRLRRDSQVPAVLYGHGTETSHISLPSHETLLALRQQNVLLSIDLPGKRSQLALPKQVQRDPITGKVEHVDLIIVRRGEKVTVDVAITVIGEPHPDAMIMVDQPTISVEAEATHIPNEIEVSVAELEPGTQILTGDLVLPNGVSLAQDTDILVVNITQKPSQEQVDAELESAVAEAEDGTAAEPQDAGDAAEDSEEADTKDE